MIAFGKGGRKMVLWRVHRVLNFISKILLLELCGGTQIIIYYSSISFFLVCFNVSTAYFNCLTKKISQQEILDSQFYAKHCAKQ